MPPKPPFLIHQMGGGNEQSLETAKPEYDHAVGQLLDKAADNSC